jgi:hypothetical protein
MQEQENKEIWRDAATRLPIHTIYEAQDLSLILSPVLVVMLHMIILSPQCLLIRDIY